MGSRRDNRSSGVGPTATLHSKHHHEKRNQELLLKRMASDTSPSYPMSHSTTTAKTASSRGGTSVMSKSLTLDIGKGRPRKKVDVEKPVKSTLRQTPRSTSKMSQSLNEKEQFVDNKTSRIRDLSPLKGKMSLVQNNLQNKTAGRKRDATTGNPLSPAGKKGVATAVDNLKRADVFDRLSRQDCNKGVTRSEHGAPGNRIRDRSPAKTGRKSPQEKNVAADKNQRNRIAAPGDAVSKAQQNKKRDSSPVKREDNGRRNVSSQGSIGRRKITRERIRCSDPGLEDDKDGSREKLEKDNVPESPDKDLEDSAVRDDVDKDLAAVSPGVLHGKEISPTHQGGVGGEKRIEVTGKVKIGRNAMHPTRPQRTSTDTNAMTSQNAHSLQGSNKTLRKFSEDKVLNGAIKDKSQATETLPKTPIRPSKPKGADTTCVELSKADVLHKVRQRVPDESKRDTKGVVDDDKDVCETEKCDEDDFYRIKVQTRLVSYSNSTLVIKNTSKGSSVGDHATVGVVVRQGGDQAKDIETESSHPPLPTPPPSPPQPRTLQTSSVPPTAAVPHSTEVEPDGGGSALPTEARLQKKVEEEVEDNSALLTRSSSMKLKLSQFVFKGKNFLTDVYSATQSKLEQYTRAESMNSITAGSTVGDNTLHTVLPNDSDSGYYSISTSLERMPSSSTGDLAGVPCPREDTCHNDDVRVDGKYPGNSESSAGGQADTPDSGMKTDLETVNHQSESVDMSNEDDEEVLPSPPSPHINFTLNDEWIKKNILCTCKCKRNVARMATDQNSDSQSSDDIVDSESTDITVIEESNCTIDNSVDVGTSLEGVDSAISPAEEEEVVVAATKDIDNDFCLCSCHESEGNQQLQQLPQEIQDLLDADHARMWWTITGNFGNILPIDWSKTYTRQQYLPVLNLNEAKALASPTDETERTAEDDAEEEEVAQDLDLHHLILNGLSAEPVKSAEEVIKEIDDLMQEGSSSEDEGVEEASSSGVNANEPITQPLPPPLYAAKLNNMSIGELNESFMELELVIRQYSETLINQLALRDELEYEKELKNSFISLLLQVQNKRRNFNVEKKKQKKVGPNGIDPKYLTTVIPYDVGHGPPQNETLQILIKILMAINEDSPTVPTLLTDYILKVLCPS